MNHVKSTEEIFAEVFKWESKDQEQGFRAYISWLEKLPTLLRKPEFEVCRLTAWFAQKDHDSAIWWAETIGDQIDTLQNDIRGLQLLIRNLTVAATVAAGDGIGGARMGAVHHSPEGGDLSDQI